MKKVIYIIILTILIVGLNVGKTQSMEKIKLMFAWIPYGKHTPFYVSLDKGFWKEEGLDVTLIRGSGSGDTIKKVAAGLAEFGKAGAEVVATARDEGVKVKIIGAYHDRGLAVIHTLKKSNIKTLKDLEGKTMAAAPTDSCKVIFPALCAINNIDAEKINWVNITGPAKIPALVTEKVDATCTLFTEDPSYEDAAKKVGKELVRLMYSDHGLDIYSISIITTDDMIKNRPEVVKRFLKGMYRGFAWSIEHPEEAVDIFEKHVPEVDKNLAKKHFKIMLDHFLTPTAYEKGMGYIREDKMKATRDIALKYLTKTEKSIPLDDLYTNAFLPGIFPPKR